MNSSNVPNAPTLCVRHESLLADAIELRGLLRPLLPGEAAGFDALAHARQAILTHATHFAGKAALRMLTEHRCPLCFVNENPARINLDAWVEDAAEDALTADLAHRDGETGPLVTLV